MHHGFPERAIVDSDEILIGRFYHGDLQAFEILHGRHFKRLTGLFSFWGLDDNAAEDCALETLTKLWKTTLSTSKYNPTRGCFATWLNGIAAKVRASYWAKRGKERSKAEPLSDKHDVAEPLQDDRMEKEEERLLLLRAARSLPSGYLDAMTLHLEGHNAKAIAQQLGITPGAVNVRLSRARDMLEMQLSTLREDGHD
jgi:RNA polymerase sigma-70 factor (ECF subfamily)